MAKKKQSQNKPDKRLTVPVWFVWHDASTLSRHSPVSEEPVWNMKAHFFWLSWRPENVTGPGCNLKRDISVSNRKGSTDILLGVECTCVLADVFVGGHMCMYIHMCVKARGSTFRVLLLKNWISCLRKVVSPWACDSLMKRLTGPQVPKSFHLQLGLWELTPVPHFKWVLEPELRIHVWRTSRQVFHSLSSISSPSCILNWNGPKDIQPDDKLFIIFCVWNPSTYSIWTCSVLGSLQLSDFQVLQQNAFTNTLTLALNFH